MRALWGYLSSRGILQAPTPLRWETRGRLGQPPGRTMQRNRLRIMARTTRDAAEKSHAAPVTQTDGTEIPAANIEAGVATERREGDAAIGAAVVTGSTGSPGIADNEVARERVDTGGKKDSTEDTEVAAGTVEDAGIGMINPDTIAAPGRPSAGIQGVIEAHAGELASHSIGVLVD